MLNRMFLSAMFKKKNLLFLLLWFISVGIFLGNISMPSISDNLEPLLYLAGLIPYSGLVIKTIKSEKFKEEFSIKEKTRRIKDLNISCIKLYQVNRRNIRDDMQASIKKVLRDKNEIISNYERTKDDFIRDNILEKTLNLVYSYIKLSRDYSMRRKELRLINLESVKERIAKNNRRLNFETNEDTKENIQKMIDMDQRLIERVKEEKIDIDSAKSKLEYIENTIGMLKHHTLTTFNRTEITGQLDEVINEASALETVLDNRRKNNMKTRI
jgi:hypothetical protein